MRLRSRFSDKIQRRLEAHLPDALRTAWGGRAVVANADQLKFKSTGGVETEDWERVAQITGLMRLELRSDGIDAQVVEVLIANLVSHPVRIEFDPATPVDGVSEKARFILADWRDIVRDTQVVTLVRFNVDCTLARRLSPAVRPTTPTPRGPEVGSRNTAEVLPR